MCLGCWEDSGRPWLLTETVTRWAPVFSNADPFGPLHIVVEDWNLDDENIKYCRDKTHDLLEKALCSELLDMSEGERWATAILAEDPNFDPELARAAQPSVVARPREGGE